MLDWEGAWAHNRETHFPALTHPCLEIAVRATVHAGQILRDFFGTKLHVQSKATANFVSEADVAAESSIVGCIQGSFPEHAIFAEEGHRIHVGGEHLWIVDPLDGTSNFLHGIPHFAVSIAYHHHGECELGIVHNPITDDWFVAVKGQGPGIEDVD